MSAQTAKAPARVVKPISETKPPKALFKVVNIFLKRMLRSPKAKIGDHILLLTFTGRKSGKQYSIPVGYRKMDDHTLVLFTDSPWYKNLRGGAPVQVLLKGRERTGRAVVDADLDMLVRETAAHLRAHGLAGAREMGIMGLKFLPTEDELRVMLRDRAKITVTLDPPGPAGRPAPAA